jgi:hypothetical protein
MPHLINPEKPFFTTSNPRESPSHSLPASPTIPAMDSPATPTCALTGRTLSPDDAVPCAGLRPSLLRFILKRFPTVTQSSIVAADALPDLKAAYVEESLADEIGEITHLERAVIRSLEEHEVISEPPEDAAALISQGSSPPVKGLDPAELAAHTVTANILLNLDESVTRN